jgi:hypothetical protein
VGDQFMPWIETDATGRVHVVYFDSRHTNQADNVVHGMFDAYYAYSEDGGNTWNESRLTATSWDSDDDGLDRPNQFLGDYLGMAVTGETVWPVYPATTNGNTDTFTNRISFTPCPLPEEVENLTVSYSEANNTLTFNWTDVPSGAVDYVLLQDLTPNGLFGITVGTAPSGSTGITKPVPPGKRFYLVAARNECGIGPK